MPGRPVTQKEREDILRLINNGLSPPAAAERVGRSRSTGWRVARGLEMNLTADARKKAEELPPPRRWEQLDLLGRECLQDFGLWAETFLAWRPIRWQVEAANQVVRHLTDKKTRDFLVINLPPGAGKTTVFSFAVPAWLICGGGILDPAKGRATRILLGHSVKDIAQEYVLRLRRLLGSRRPWYDFDTEVFASHVLAEVYGRFRPQEDLGDEDIWTQEHFVVAQVEDVDLYQKEYTVQAASMKGEFTGTRVDYASWDDVVTDENAHSPERTESLERKFVDIAEKRMEPGGCLALVGQRLGANDLFRRRLDSTWTNEHGELVKKYTHIIYPLHQDDLCDGQHRQWTGEEGCILDEVRYSTTDLLQAMAEANYRTVYQQEDADPERRLVLPEWLSGQKDFTGYEGPGCFDDGREGTQERGFYEHPQNVGALIDYATVDPAAGGWWVIEWWAVQPETRFRYLIAGFRKRMPAGGSSGLLDWDPVQRRHVGLMDDLQSASTAGSHPIRVWVVESNSAQRWLFQFNHFRTWRSKWWGVVVIPHESQRNKTDPTFGVEAALQMPYRTGMKRLPKKKGDLEAMRYITQKQKELTNYPDVETDDTVMADWFGEFNMEKIIHLGRATRTPHVPDSKLPPYLMRQRQEMTYAD